MIVKLRKRARRESDGPNFGKTNWVYELVDHPNALVCDWTIESVLKIHGVKEGGVVELSITQIEHTRALPQATNADLLAELADRLGEKS